MAWVNEPASVFLLGLPFDVNLSNRREASAAELGADNKGALFGRPNNRKIRPSFDSLRKQAFRCYLASRSREAGFRCVEKNRPLFRFARKITNRIAWRCFLKHAG